MDPAPVFAAVKIIGHSHDHHYAANEREKIRECENDGEFIEHKGPDEITVHMDHSGQDGNDGADHYFQSAVRILPRQIHDLYRNLSVFPLDCILLVRTPARTRDERRHLFVFSDEVVVFTTRRGIQQRFQNEVEAAHVFVSPILLFGGIFVGMIDLRNFLECMLDRSRVCITSDAKLIVEGSYPRHCWWITLKNSTPL